MYLQTVDLFCVSLVPRHCLSYGGLSRGNTWLRAILEGGLVHLDVVSASSLSRVVSVLKHRKLCEWHSVPGSPVATLRAWLRSRGWRETGPWSWTIDGLPTFGIGLSMLPANMHVLRQGWRWWCWNRFLKTPRHEIRSAGLDRVNMSDFARCNWKLIRLAGVDAARRSVMLAAFVSCAWLGRASGCDDRCLW